MSAPYGTEVEPDDPRLVGPDRAQCMLGTYKALEDGNGGLFLVPINDKPGIFPKLKFFTQPPLGFDVSRRK